MSDTRKGVVGYVSPGKEFRGSTLYSFKLDGDDTWYGCGESKPGFSAGDMVMFDCNTMNGRTTVMMESIKMKKGEAPVAAPKPAGKAWGGKKDPAKDQYWTDREAKDDARQKAITYQAARKDALTFLEMAVQAEGVKLPAASNKKYDALMAMVDELTLKFYHDTQNMDSLIGKDVKEVEEAPEPEEESTPDFNDEWDGE